HNNLPIEVEGSVGFIRQWGNTPQFVLKGVSWSDLTAENFAPIQDDHLREDASAVLAWENGTAPTRPNTVYLRSHEIGLQEEADFDPKTDKISFMYYGNRGENSEVEEIDRGVRFYSNVTGQSMLLKGVKFSDLDGSHFEARMSWLKEDDSPARMGLREAMPDLAIPAGNVFSREGIPVAGLEDRDLAYLQGFDKPYTPVAGPLLPVSKDPMASEDYKPVGQPAPTGGHQHNHSDGTHSDMMMAGGETADSVSSPMLPMIPSVADSVTDSSAPTTSPIMPLRDLAAQGSTGLLDLDTAYMGKGTFYGATGAGNAGYDEVPASQRGMLTAINRRQWDNSEASGAFLQVSGPKQRNGQADPITVMVVDQLPDRGNGLDLSVEAFAKVANPVDGVVNLDYALASPDDSFTTPYGNKIGDGLIVDRLADSNPYWPAVRLMNHRHPVESLELVAEGGELLPMKRQSYNVFVLEQGIGEPLT
ncbi:MAG: expansin EXLX1 family cellulose-binding protein, partial [Cyanobacteria bacterium J06626_14]